MTRGQLFWFGATSPFHKVQQSIAALNPPILNAPALNVQENCARRGGPFSPTAAQQHLTTQWGLQPPARRPWGSCFAGSGAGQSISSVCCSPRSPWARSRRSGGDRERGITCPGLGSTLGAMAKGPVPAWLAARCADGSRCLSVGESWAHTFVGTPTISTLRKRCLSAPRLCFMEPIYRSRAMRSRRKNPCSPCHRVKQEKGGI